MPLIQSEHAKGRLQAPYAAEAGNVVAVRYTIDASLVAAGDVVELGILPAYCRVVDATLVAPDLAAVTANVGLIDAAPGEVTEESTVGTEMFDGAAAGVTRLEAAEAFLLEAGETDAAIGLTLSGAGAGSVTLLLQYAAAGVH